LTYQGERYANGHVCEILTFGLGSSFVVLRVWFFGADFTDFTVFLLFIQPEFSHPSPRFITKTAVVRSDRRLRAANRPLIKSSRQIAMTRNPHKSAKIDLILSLPIYDVSMSFGRKYELSIIKDAIASDRAELGIVHGRRRIGKSPLLMKATSRKGDLHFEALQNVSLKKQIDHFLYQLAEQVC